MLPCQGLTHANKVWKYSFLDPNWGFLRHVYVSVITVFRSESFCVTLQLCLSATVTLVLPTVTNIWQNAHSNSFYTHMCSSHMYSLSTHSSKQQCPSDPCQPGRSISEHKACLGTHEMALFTFAQRISRVYQSSNSKPVDVLACNQKVIVFEALSLVLFHWGCSKCSIVHSISLNSDHLCL